ncbi:MAG: HDOD domain-containing protein [Spirochaetales bacterium]|nr:HDOD domain-containing protein [Spirochaetales bacterium]
MERENVLYVMKSYIEKMPSLPTTVAKILQICNDPKTSPTDLNRLISLDPVLMGKVMKLINSAYYGLSQKITSLVRAIIMLGINTVKNLSLSTAVLASLGKKTDFQALNMEGFWKHSICVGSTAKLIAKKRNIDPKLLEEYFIAGLLHDIGKIPLNNRLSKNFIEALAEAERSRHPLYFAEQHVLNVDHSEIGKLIVESWKLSKDIVDVVLFHHNLTEYQGEHLDILYTVAISNYFANVSELGFSGDRFPEKIQDDVFNYLGIGWQYLEDIEDDIKKEIEKAQIFLEVVK